MATMIKFHIPRRFQQKAAGDRSQRGKLIEFPKRFVVDELCQSATVSAKRRLLPKQRHTEA
jgi:hypothetical protein